MTTDVPRIFDTALLVERQRRAIARGGVPDFLLMRAAEDLAERLEVIKRSFPRAAAIGPLWGSLPKTLGAVQTVGHLDQVAYGSGDFRQGEGRAGNGLEALPLEAGSLDLVASALVLQLVNDLPGVLAQIRRALKPDGLFLATLIGGDSLKELREAWLLAETEMLGGASPRVAPFVDVRDLGALLQRAGFALPVVDSERLDVTYATPLALMHEVKAMAGSNALVERSRRPVSRRLLLRAAEIYAERFARAGGRVTATFELLTVTAWAPHESQQKALRPGSAAVSLADVLKRKD